MAYTLSQIDQHHFGGPEDVYVLDAHRTSPGLAAISSDQALSLLDPTRLGAGPLASVATGHEAVTGLRVFDAAGGVVCTAGEDGCVAVWDLRQGARVARFAASQGVSILSLACNQETHTIAVGTELENHTACVHIWDVRSTPAQTAQYDSLHSDDITSLAFHPSTPHLLISGSTDGLASIHDLRVADEDELTVQTFNHDASVHEAAFLSRGEVFALSHDERFRLYDAAEERVTGDAVQDFGDLRETLGCRYVAGVTTKRDGSGAIIGAGAQDRQSFELVYMAKNQQTGLWDMHKDARVSLRGAHGGEVVRSFCCYDEEQVVFTTGEDGNIKAWRASS
ncbi:putative WD repeat-containing protein [Escovopsis weberi]|uniref:Putative WD repeat-containing protein n=1 Tax=Escovopsis weberi TaxID=150374 RepID=A0A0N0RTW6_ESCWE|nr:putative WD repeat-containing protein [Escovopsis weberi]